MFTFPANTLDDRDALLALLGSFWSRTYTGRSVVQSMVFARAREERQAQADYQEMVAALSRTNLPVYHRDHWYQLRILQSQINSQPAYYGEGYVYGPQPDNEIIQYGQPVKRPDFVVEVPDELKQVLVLTDRLTSPSVSLLAGVDFVLEPGRLRFNSDPFENDLLVRHPIYTGSEITDWAVVLWLNQSDWDRRYIYTHFGYLIGPEKKSSLAYKDFVNAVLDGWLTGTARRHLEALFAAVLDAPVASGDEVVEYIKEDRNRLWIVTDKQAYDYSKNAQAIVAVGDELVAGQQLTDTVTFYEFTQGSAPDDLARLSLDTQFLLPGFASGLSFPNEDVPLVVEENVDGKTKVSFQLGGIPTDVDRFFDELHSRAASLNQSTLAELLDVRGPGQTTQPIAASLPATINPYQFLVSNVLRYNFAAVKLKLDTTDLPAGDLQLLDARVVRRLIPPWQALLILIELSLDGDEVSLESPAADEFGSEVDSEPVSVGELDYTSYDLSSMIDETVQIFYVPCPCG